jgi:hypothetical protein
LNTIPVEEKEEKPIQKNTEKTHEEWCKQIAKTV